jgi:hypothetical protein
MVHILILWFQIPPPVTRPISAVLRVKVAFLVQPCAMAIKTVLTTQTNRIATVVSFGFLSVFCFCVFRGFLVVVFFLGGRVGVV